MIALCISLHGDKVWLEEAAASNKLWAQSAKLKLDYLKAKS